MLPGGSQTVKVFCRQETPQVETEGSSEMHYFHQKNALDLIKEFEDLLGESSSLLYQAGLLLGEEAL